MTVCSECHGAGYLKHLIQPIETYLGSMTFTAPAQGYVRVCPTCLGGGINKGSGT